MWFDFVSVRSWMLLCLFAFVFDCVCLCVLLLGVYVTLVELGYVLIVLLGYVLYFMLCFYSYFVGWVDLCLLYCCGWL